MTHDVDLSNDPFTLFLSCLSRTDSKFGTTQMSNRWDKYKDSTAARGVDLQNESP